MKLTEFEDFPVEAKKIKCKECNREMWRLTNTHLWYNHHMTIDEYKEKYVGSVIEDPLISTWRQRNRVGKTYEEIHGIKKAIELKKDRSEKTTEQMKDIVQIAIRQEKCGYDHTEEQKQLLREQHTIHGGSNYRDRALEYYGEECMRCGSTEKLIVHHIDYNNIQSELGNHDISNLMVLCKPCHGRIHNELKRGKFIGISSIEKGVHYILKGLKDEFGLDLSDVNFKDTPKRVSRAYYEMCCGIKCEDDINSIISTSFPSEYDGMIVQRDIRCYSMCPHHLLPVEYKVNIGYVPDKTMLGISKLTRIVKLLAKAPKLQEQYTHDIIEVFKKMGCKGAIVQVSGYHLCMGARGVEMPDARTITSSLCGVFEEQETRNEFQMMLGK
jgi:GTP cyclohydrolase I